MSRYATLERVLPDGEPDPSFGKEGLVVLPNRSSSHKVNESVRSVLVLEDGDLLIAGVGVIYSEGVKEENYDWLARLTQRIAGSKLRSRGKEYVPALTPSQSERGVSLVREPDGVIVLAGNEPTGAEHWLPAAWGFLPPPARALCASVTLILRIHQLESAYPSA